MRFAAFILLLAPGACSANHGCTNTMLETRPDTRGPLVAWRYVRQCGAADISMNIAVGTRSGGLVGATSVFTADTGNGPVEMDGKYLWVEMQWTRPHQLSVAYAEKARVSLSVRAARGAAIRYRASASAARPQLPIPPPQAR